MTHINALRTPRAIYTGEGLRHLVGHYAAAIGTRALVVTDERFSGTAHFAEILLSLEESGVSAVIFSDAKPDLPSEQINAVASLAADVDLLVGVGGGSCMDLAKAAGVVRTHGGRIQDYYGENRIPGPILPIIAMPTTAGTGSEVTPVAVIADEDRKVKLGVSSEYLIPQVALVDPELTYSSPPALTAAVGADTLAHLVESFTARRRERQASSWTENVFLGKGVLTDVFAREGLRLIATSLNRAYTDGSDKSARAAMSLAATYGGLALGTAGTAAAHALQYPIGVLTHTPHGVGVGILLPYVMRYNRDHALAEFAEIGDIFGAPGLSSAEEKADFGILAVTDLLRSIGIPSTLAEIGITRESLQRIAHESLGSSRLIQNNPRPLDESDLLRITEAAFVGDEPNLSEAPIAAAGAEQ